MKARRKRTQAVDLTGPPQVRQHRRPGTPGSVSRMDEVERDGQRTRNWRVFCAVRRCAVAGDVITHVHIAAADQLRASADIARLGATAPRDLDAPANDLAYGPRGGPSNTALQQVWAGQEVQRVVAVLTAPQLTMLSAVVLGNSSLSAWSAAQAAATGHRVDKKVEIGRLATLLDIVAKLSDRERR